MKALMATRITGTEDGQYWFDMTTLRTGGSDSNGYKQFYWYVLNGTLHEWSVVS